jgi:hypothetical protein
MLSNKGNMLFMNFKKFLLVCIVLSIFHVGKTQSIFYGSAVVGVNASQLDGDLMLGYDKLGLNAGVEGGVMVDKNLAVNFQILYSQRGSRTKPGVEGEAFRRINLDFVEVPVTLRIMDWKSEDESYYRVHGFAGLVYSRLFSARQVNSGGFERFQDNFQPNQIGFTLGAAYHINKHLKVEGRWSRGLTWIFDRRDFLGTPGVPVTSLRERWLNLQLGYTF